MAAVNAATGRQEVNLFFNRFEYIDERKKIQFSAFNKVFFYDLAVEALIADETDKCISLNCGQPELVPLEIAVRPRCVVRSGDYRPLKILF